MFIPLALGAESACQDVEKLAVIGRGEVTLLTNWSDVSIAVELTSKDLLSSSNETNRLDAALVQKEVSRRAQDVVDFLQYEPDLRKLQTTTISLQPEYKWKNREKVFLGFKAIQGLSFRAPNEIVGMVLDAVVRKGANRIRNMAFVAEDDEEDMAVTKALQRASKDAITKAKSILEAMGMDPKNLRLHHVKPHSVRPYGGASYLRAENVALADRATFGAVPVVGGEHTIKQELHCTFHFRPLGGTAQMPGSDSGSSCDCPCMSMYPPMDWGMVPDRDDEIGDPESEEPVLDSRRTGTDEPTELDREIDESDDPGSDEPDELGSNGQR